MSRQKDARAGIPDTGICSGEHGTFTPSFAELQGSRAPQTRATILAMGLNRKESAALIHDLQARHNRASSARWGRLVSTRLGRMFGVIINAAAEAVETRLTAATFALTAFRAPLCDALENTKEDSK